MHAWVPEPLLRETAFSMLLWQWLALPLLFALALLIGLLASRVTLTILCRLTRKTTMTWDDVLVQRSRGPMRVLFAVIVARALLPVLQLPDGVEHIVIRGLVAVSSVAVFWALFRTADILAHGLASTRWAQATAASSSLIPIGARVAKVVIAILAIGTALSLLGVPVASIVAGLGVGGLAVALAAQKTFENLLGAFSIGVDQPFREGDFVKIDDFVGTVERVGLRTTQICSLDRTIITLPNGQLAEKRIETFALRDRIRLNAVLGLLYSTTEAQMRQVMAGLLTTLRSHPKIWPDTVIVRFIAFSESSLDLEVMAWFLTTDFDEFCAIRTEVFLQFMGVVQQAGTGFAFPTRTLHLASVPQETHSSHKAGAA